MAILVLPIIIITSMEAIRAVPQGLRDAGYGVGASRWEVTRDHVLPYAAPGILTGTVLAIARALGEAAPLILIGAITGLLPRTGLTENFTALPMLIFNWAGGRTPRARRSAGSTRRPRPASSCSPSFCSSTLQRSCSATGSRRSESARERPREGEYRDRPDHLAENHGRRRRIAAQPGRACRATTRPPRGRSSSRVRRRRPERPLRRLPCRAGRDDRRAPARDHGLHRPVGLRQDDGHALLQPDERLHRVGQGRGHDQLPRRQPLRQRRRRHRGAAAHRDGVPEAEPVPEEHLRQRRLRPAAGRR